MMIPGWMGSPPAAAPAANFNGLGNLTSMFPPGQMIIGRWVKNFAEVKGAPMLADGGTNIYLLTDEPIMYLAGINEQGRPVISGFKIVPLGEGEENTPSEKPLTIDERMARMEAVLPDILSIIKQVKPLLDEEETK